MTPTPAQREALTRIADEFAGLARQIRVLTTAEDERARPEGIERWQVAFALTPYMDVQTRVQATAAVWELLTQPETPAQDAHTPREQPQTRSGGTESGEGGGGALRVFFGGDDERRMWTWECTDGHPAAFGDEPTEYKAFAAIVQHWKTRHPLRDEIQRRLGAAYGVARADGGTVSTEARLVAEPDQIECVIPLPEHLRANPAPTGWIVVNETEEDA